MLDPTNAEKYAKTTLGEYLDANGYSRFFVENYVTPMCAAIWSCSDKDTAAFPIVTLIRFWVNHHLLNIVERPLWRVVKGRSKAYVDAVVGALPAGAVRLNADVTSVRRHAAGAKGAVSVTWTETRGGDSKTLKDTAKAKAKESVGYFDEVVMAARSDQTLRVLGDAATAAERAAWPPCGTSRTTCICTRTRR